MNAEVIGGITIRPLRNGETGVVQAVFDRLGAQSRRLRFGGAKNVLTRNELEHLARVDGNHHVLVAWHGGDSLQGNGVGSVLSERLAEDGRAAGISTLRATMSPGNRASLALMRRMTAGLDVRFAAGQMEVVGCAA